MKILCEAVSKGFVRYMVSSLSLNQLKQFDMISSCKIQIDMDSSSWEKIVSL